MAVFADMGASLLVVFNGLRLTRGQGTQSTRLTPWRKYLHAGQNDGDVRLETKNK